MALNRRLTLLIALCFGGLLAFSLFVNYTRRVSLVATATAFPTAAIAQTGQFFPEVQPDQITRITVRDVSTGAQITLEKRPGEWVASDANGTPARFDLANVPRIVQILGTLRYNRVIIDQNAAAYGLAGEGRMNVVFAAGGSMNTSTHQLRVGDLAQVSGQTFVQRDADSAIYLAPTQSLDALRGLLAGSPP